MPTLKSRVLFNYPGELSRKALAKAHYDFSSPFLLKLAHHEEPLICDEVLRIIPGKRLVFFGRWNERAVVGKIFFGRHAKQHVQREQDGVQALLHAKIPTPQLLHSDTTLDKGIQVLIFERITSAESLESYWQKHKSDPAGEPLLHALVLELATQHVLGIEQADLHLKNFLVACEKIYTLDGDGIHSHEGPLSTKQSLENLALFFSQLGIYTNKLQQRLFETYVEARRWLVKKSDVRLLQKTIRHWNGSRWLDYSKKIFRSSTSFAKKKTLRVYSLSDRAYATPAFQAFLDNPDVAMAATDAALLKDGRSSTVVAVTVDGHRLAVKRYNVKSFWHGLSLLFKTSRAKLSWRLSHQLHFVGLPTAKPVAFIEKRFLGFRRQSYFIMEFIDGQRADAFFDAAALNSETSSLVAKRIISLFFQLARLRLSHGDLKITNILLTSQQEPVLIDFDGMREHRSSRSLWQRFSKDLERFLDNWRERPDLRGLFQDLIGEMSGGNRE